MILSSRQSAKAAAHKFQGGINKFEKCVTKEGINLCDTKSVYTDSTNKEVDHTPVTMKDKQIILDPNTVRYLGLTLCVKLR